MREIPLPWNFGSHTLRNPLPGDALDCYLAAYSRRLRVIGPHLLEQAGLRRTRTVYRPSTNGVSAPDPQRPRPPNWHFCINAVDPDKQAATAAMAPTA